MPPSYVDLGHDVSIELCDVDGGVAANGVHLSSSNALVTKLLDLVLTIRLSSSRGMYNTQHARDRNRLRAEIYE